jgi:hypothetical protein
MANATLNDCTQLDTTVLERVNYFPRQLLTADDMTADQAYFLAKLRRHNRFLHGWGVVCGMEVSVAATANNPWQVQIGAGYALGPYGDEIYIPSPVTLDLAQCGPGSSTDPCDPGSLLQGTVSKTGALLYIAVRYEECFSRPVRVMPGGCGCDESNCEPSRISDSYEIECLSDLPPSSQPGEPGVSLCDIVSGQALAQCPPCPTDPWVVLARVQLPGISGTVLVQGQVDNTTFRRKLFSTAAIQAQLILCCCKGSDRSPARVTSINPPGGQVFTNASTVPPAVILTFSKHLTAATVTTSTILVVRVDPATGQSKPLQGTVTYDDGTQTAQFVPAEAFTIAGTYLVTVVGSGPNQIVDSDNLALDGNDDGLAGGNFISQFSVTVPNPTPTPTPTPTVASSPITLLVAGPAPVPQGQQQNPTALGPLLLTFSGGAPGQSLLGDVMITLSTKLAKTAAADTAVLEDADGNKFQGVKGANTYTFKAVKITMPAAGDSVARVVNMKANASIQSRTAFDITALLSFASTPSTQVKDPSQVVAHILAG